MKAIIDNVIYNTFTSKKLCKYFNNFSRGGILTPVEKWSHRVVLYQAKNGMFFEYNLTKKCLRAIDVDTVKENLMRFAPSKYVKLFGGVSDSSKKGKV